MYSMIGSGNHDLFGVSGAENEGQDTRRRTNSTIVLEDYGPYIELMERN